MRRFAESEGVTFPLLVDPGAEVIERWGVLNEEKGGVPHPTVVVVGRDGLVLARWTDPDYRKRPPVDAVLAALGET